LLLLLRMLVAGAELLTGARIAAWFCIEVTPLILLLLEVFMLPRLLLVLLLLLAGAVWNGGRCWLCWFAKLPPMAWRCWFAKLAWLLPIAWLLTWLLPIAWLLKPGAARPFGPFGPFGPKLPAPAGGYMALLFAWRKFACCCAWIGV